MRRLVVLVLALVALAAAAPTRAGADGAPVVYRPPVDAPLTDRFRPPATEFGAGNLGVDYGTTPGTTVRAAAPGQVVFAGPVGNTLHVVVLHADGVRTTYAFLASITVMRGQAVGMGAAVGTSGAGLHFGARVGEAYVDPLVLLASGPPEVRLVPDALKRPAAEADERSNLTKFLGVLGGAARATAAAAEATAAVGAQAIDWAKSGVELAAELAVAAGQEAIDRLAARIEDRLDELRLLAHYAVIVAMPYKLEEMLTVLAAADEWRRDQRRCTPASVAAPVLGRRHVVVKVAGLGSHQSVAEADTDLGGAAFAVDTAALGYAPGDTHHFSYQGGTTAEHGYTAADTQIDIRESGRRLRALLERLQYEHPGVTIDLIAHSQGGLVVRSALGESLEKFDPRTPRIGTVVTLATPHHGANTATMGALLGHTMIGQAVDAVGGAVRPAGIDPGSTSVRQLAETSSFIRDLNDNDLPEDVRFVSIAARGDVVVPSPQAHLDGATNVILDVDGLLTDHDQLPRSAVAQREIALAVNGLGPSCETWADAHRDAVEGLRISAAEDRIGAGIGLLAELADLPGW
jgi:murein DD-endopeptidase MepM/ murein hydrolase activator NlpD/triacylglycerol esterase/lipase EstA (alpha/beta hydrolase family)